MPDSLLVTKISLPMLRRISVPRIKILRQLNEGVHDGHLLTLVSAPPGYGKTTTIRVWVEETGYPIAWVSLEKSDNDLKQFITYTLTALGQAWENLGQAALEVIENSQKINIHHILGLLANDLHNLDQPIILVLEDYHLIDNDEIDQFIELILNQSIANIHLVITTREDPNLPLTRLRVRNQLTEIRAADLSFSLDEASDFFSNVMRVNLPRKEMEILETRTEGWAAGLQLVALSLKDSADPIKFVEAFRGTHRHILDYLLDEVLNSLAYEIQEFLRQTSILDQLSPSICEAVTGMEASRKYLQYLETNNLFLISLDEERTWYRYHTLFGELLKNQLMLIEPERVDDLHGRAADWYGKNGFIQKAVEHGFQISNSNKVFQLIEQHALPMLYKGEVAIVTEWFDRLPETLIQNNPMMCISKAWAFALPQHQRRTPEEIVVVLKAADNALNRVNADEALRNLIAGHAASIQAYLMQATISFPNEIPEKLIETSQRAQRLLPEEEKGIRSVNALNIGYGYLMLSDSLAAEKAYKQSAEYGIAGGNLYAGVYGQIGLIGIAMMKGQLKDALQLCEANIDRFNRLLAGQRFPPIGDLYSLKGSILLEENQLVEAEQALTMGLNLIRLTGEFDAHMRGFTALARLRSIQGDWLGIQECINFIEEFQPKDVVHAQALRQRMSVRTLAADKTRMEEAHLWVIKSGVRFDTSLDVTNLGLVGRIRFQTCLNVVHILSRLAKQNPKIYPLTDAQHYLARQEKFFEAHELFGWLVEIWIARALMYQVEGKTEDARRMIEMALSASVSRGYFRIFLDEADLMRPLLESIEPSLKDNTLSAFVKRLLEAISGESAKTRVAFPKDDLLSDREIEVLGLLAKGQSYKEIGQKLFLSLNTVQFHIKSIYRKLSVNKRIQAIETAREMKLI
jgi:LuxR family maltose regulon positive regulatory protein